MSVKCGYTIKYYPLLSRVFNTSTDEEFKSFLEEYFIDPDSVYRMFLGGISTNPTQTSIFEPKKISSRTGWEVKTDSKSAQQFYIGQSVQYNKMTSDFVKKIISLSVFDLANEQFIDANRKVGDITVLNRGIFEYKKELLGYVLSYLGKPSPNLDSMTDIDIESTMESALSEFSGYINNSPNLDNKYYQAYNSYVTLRTFDDLLKQLTPFVSINPEYSKSSIYSRNRYIYNGPNVTHYTGFSTNEFMSQEESVSDLAKILLNYLPEVNVNGDIIDGTSISLSGFNSVMGKMKLWAEESSNPEIKEELNKGTKMNVSKLISLYEQELSSRKVSNPEHITYLRSKLSAIKRFIYDSKMHEDIKNMFTHLMEKTVLSSYVSYEQKDGKNMEVRNLTQRPVKMQREAIVETVKAITQYWKQNKTRFNELLRKYNVRVMGSVISIGDSRITLEGNGKISITGPVNNFNEIVGDFVNLLISDDFDQIASQVFPNSNYTKYELYAPVLGTVIFNVINNSQTNLNFGQSNDLGRVLSVINGSDTVNVIKNAEGNNLTLYQMICLSYQHNGIFNEITKQLENNSWYTSQYYDNAVYQNIQHVKSPKIRSEVTINGVTKQSSALTADDVMHLSIVYDFYQGLTTDQSHAEGSRSKSGIVGIQSHVYSDKNKHFVMQFDLNQTWNFGNGNSFNVKSVLDQYFKSGDESYLEPIKKAWFESNKSQVESAIETILSDYRQVYPNKEFNSIHDIKVFLAKNKINRIREDFARANVEFVDEIHASKTKAGWVFNETLENFANIFSNRDKFNEFYKNQFSRFLEDSSKAWDTISVDQNIVNSFKQNNPKFVRDGKLLKEVNGIINPLLGAYFITDSFLSNEYNKMMVGDVYAHPNKEKESPTTNGYLDHSLASRWISQVKRMVIYGATYHSLAQGLKNGVPERVKMAVISDMGSNVNNMSGMSSTVDSMDGSGYTSPFMSRWENVSLIDAAVGANKKTIFHDIDAKHGLPKLLKWAEYEITNAIRRNSSDTSMENIFKKMHSLELPLDVTIDYDRQFDDLFFRDSISGKYYKILHVNISNNVAHRELVEVTKEGVPINPDNIIITDKLIRNIYDIDQTFGGAWAMKIDDRTNNLQYSEHNLDYTNQIICDYDLKDSMISWLVNKSAIKVGASNINDVTSWNDSTPLLFTTMSTKFGGVQMNADHELDEAEVTEMTQMISGLEQNGYTHHLATQVYEEIGKFCYDAISKIQDIIYNGNKDDLYKIFGKAVIKAFAGGSKDTLGLAQSFVKLAQEGLENNNLEYRIPFSSSSINGIFNSTVTSSLVRDAIRRHYNGVAAVLNPSYNVVQYHTINGENYRYEELIDLIAETTRGTTYERMTVDDAINKVFVADTNGNVVVNPFIDDITPDNPVDFEDTIIVWGENNQVVKIDKIDNYDKYIYYRLYEPGRMSRWTTKAKNLKGSDTTFVTNGRKYSMFESPYAQVLHYFIESDSSATNIETLRDELRSEVIKSIPNERADENVIENIVNSRLQLIVNEITPFMPNGFTEKTSFTKYIPNIKKALIKKQQSVLNNLADGKPIDWGGLMLNATECKVIPAQIIMGKLYAKELGLLPGDSIAKIKEQGPEFFINRIESYYNFYDNADELTYDWTLFDGAGNKLYVKLRNPKVNELFTNSSLDSDYKIIDGSVYFNGNEICSSEGKQFLKYTDSDNVQHNVVIIDSVDRLKELENSKMFTYTHRNYRIDNYVDLVKEEFGEGTSIQLTYRPTGSRKYTTSNIAEFNDKLEIIRALAENQDYNWTKQIRKLAENKYKSFEKSLYFVGTRIPCQSMQSFMPVEVVTFTDSETNEIFVPSNQTWLQGSDYDIDKSYVLGYSVSSNGRINTDENAAPYLRADALRNRVVDGIFNVILNPRNQINLTMPVTTDRMQGLAKRSKMGEAAKYMSPYNPASKYLMQIQNMVGKAVIGNVATALKSFFALSNVYNTKFREINEAIQTGNFDIARTMLKRYTFIHNDRLITLANVNMEVFESLPENTPEDIRQTLAQVISYEDALDDQSMVLGELLNAATDENSKQ